MPAATFVLTATVVVLLVACSGSEESEGSAASSSSSAPSSAAETSESEAPEGDSEFCTQSQELLDGLGAAFSGQDPASVESAFSEAAEGFRSVEPPAEIKAQQDLYRRLLATADAPGQQALMAELLENAADQFLVWGVSLPPDGYGVVKNDIVNLMPVMPNSYGWPTPGPARPEQFFRAS